MFNDTYPNIQPHNIVTCVPIRKPHIFSSHKDSVAIQGKECCGPAKLHCFSCWHVLFFCAMIQAPSYKASKNLTLDLRHHPRLTF